ncbi:RcpC/CpaB family pilus assembly protein [Euzebya sp.]|uniref:RcpC/CpaB family pilus assembly protein n=1 Tax=Euzebya sp. TaxID=1971409 RepID=UPI0035126651
MRREDFIDATSDDVDAAIPDAAPGRARRPLHGGWVLMVAAGLIAAVANYALLTGDDPTTAVVVVEVAAPAGTPVEDLAVAARPVPIDDPAANLLVVESQMASLAGTVTTARLEAGTMLRITDLRVPAGEGRGAMSLPVDPARAAGGLIVPGDVVDVIAGDDEEVDYVVTAVEVLDVREPGSGVGQIGGSHAITVSVDADQALALAAALRAGDIDVVRAASP